MHSVPVITDPPRILVIEDDAADVDLLREALTGVVPDHTLEVCTDGEAAFAHLSSIRGRPDLAPHLILLDLGLPKMPGSRVLADLKADEDFCGVPVVILSTSNADADIEECYRLQASSYVVKATSFAEFVDDIDGLIRYWFDVVARPPA